MREISYQRNYDGGRNRDYTNRYENEEKYFRNRGQSVFKYVRQQGKYYKPEKWKHIFCKRRRLAMSR